MSLIALQFAVLWGARHIWAVIGFVLLLVLTALGVGGGLQTQDQVLGAGWLMLLLHAMAMFSLMIAKNDQKYEFFLALKQNKAFQTAQIIVFLCSQLPVMIAWGLGFGMITGRWLDTGCVCFVMMIFCSICAQAVFQNLQNHLVCLSRERRLALLLVVAGPWILTAWILSMISANALIMSQKSDVDVLLPILGLGGLGFFQWWIGRRC